MDWISDMCRCMASAAEDRLSRLLAGTITVGAEDESSSLESSVIAEIRPSDDPGSLATGSSCS